MTKQQVIAALAELRVNRPRDQADRHIRYLLRTFGDGATSIGNLNPVYYEAVFAAAGGVVSAEDFYGVHTDVDATPNAVLAPASQTPRDAAPRTRSPMVADLEARLAARAGKPRSKPNYVVNYGNPGRSEDQADDVARDFPQGRKMS